MKKIVLALLLFCGFQSVNAQSIQLRNWTLSYKMFVTQILAGNPGTCVYSWSTVIPTGTTIGPSSSWGSSASTLPWVSPGPTTFPVTFQRMQVDVYNPYNPGTTFPVIVGISPCYSTHVVEPIPMGGGAVVTADWTTDPATGDVTVTVY